jgi:hypothetical protein
MLSLSLTSYFRIIVDINMHIVLYCNENYISYYSASFSVLVLETLFMH